MGENVTSSLTWIEHRGVRILYGDYRGLQGDSLAREISQNAIAVVALAKRDARNDLLLLTDIRDCLFSEEAASAVMAAGKALAPHMKAAAAVGVVGFQTFLGKSFTSRSAVRRKRFDSVDEAKEWLVRQ